MKQKLFNIIVYNFILPSTRKVYKVEEFNYYIPLLSICCYKKKKKTAANVNLIRQI